MKQYQKILSITLVGSLMSGCMSMNPERSLFGGERVTPASANQIFDEKFEGFTDEQLLYLLDPVNEGNSKQDYNKLNKSQRIKHLRKAFRNANYDKNIYGKAHRSQIQDRLIAASNQRCNLYMTYLKRMSSYTNGIFGTLTTVLGGAGAIVTGESSARLLSGLAGISSGTRAELNQAIFESVATSVIIPGIQNSRKDRLNKILTRREDALDKYTIEGAIADVILYHGECSMDAGISYAQKSIQSFDDIGIKRLTAIQNDLGFARTLSESFTFGSQSSVIVAKNVLDTFIKQLDTYKDTIKKISTTTELKELKTMLLEKLKSFKSESTQEDGKLYLEAIELDNKLKNASFNYTVAKNEEKSVYFNTLKTQQMEAKIYAKKLEDKSGVILIELNKLAM